MINLRVIGLVLVCTVSLSGAQPLDWSTDMTIFGSADNEQYPALISIGQGTVLRALCVKTSGYYSSRVSVDFGSTWSDFADLAIDYSQPFLAASSSGNYSFCLAYGRGSNQRMLRRFTAANNEWSSTSPVTIAPARTGQVYSAAIHADRIVQPDSPTVNVCWTEYNPVSTTLQAIFAQSIDSGMSFRPEQMVFSRTNQFLSSAEIALTISGSHNAPKIVTAAPIDGAGTLPTSITVFYSENQGNSWSNGLVIDPSPVGQDEPDLLARGDSLLLTYTRRDGPNGKRNIVITYSLDGGLTFAPPAVVLNSSRDERTPHLAFLTDPEQFGLFFLADSTSDAGGSVYLCQGSLLTPWILSDTLRISGDDPASFTTGLSVASTINGVAVCWSSRFETGDLDIRFDASWRGSAVSSGTIGFPGRFALSPCYPNPFNNVTTLPLNVQCDGLVTVTLTDLLGRTVWESGHTFLTAGQHALQLDLRDHASGTYIARVDHPAGTLSTKLVLIK